MDAGAHRRTCGITVEEVVEPGARIRPGRKRGEPVAIRMNYGLQRVRGGGMAVRNIACLPALVGAWRHPAGGVQLSTSGSFPANKRALQRPDLLPAACRAPST
jgi:anaerobic selenocysteine-containing dehydrogenase